MRKVLQTALLIDVLQPGHSRSKHQTGFSHQKGFFFTLKTGPRLFRLKCSPTGTQCVLIHSTSSSSRGYTLARAGS